MNLEPLTLALTENVRHLQQKVDNPNCACRHGKIARLPRKLRDMVNRMLDDGLP